MRLGRSKSVIGPISPAPSTRRSTPFGSTTTTPPSARTPPFLLDHANYLLDRQIAALEEAFVEGVGYSEQLATESLRKRRGDLPDRSDPSDQKPPACPSCGALMALRTANAGKNAGSQFWGCTAYTTCKGTVEV
jgi:four helix bundle suffix protein